MPLISFTFDDFPLSALEVGGEILRQHGVAGTYYVSLGLLDREESVGRICSAAHVKEVLAQGHELGCHTFEHCNAWDTEPLHFEKSILDNRLALKEIISNATFMTMSYPIDVPSPSIKQLAAQYFACMRAGGQGINRGTIDLNFVRSFFLEQSRDTPSVISELIDRNRAEKGWLIFSTHDVTNMPTQYGCTPELFVEVVRQAMASGAGVMPVAKALSLVRGY
ncbi:MAG TPA: polysaccharide deacetylase family protein [Nitrospira sp.]|nr:polysaccharide deacetylase family protein [Nitrospira sp.]